MFCSCLIRIELKVKGKSQYSGNTNNNTKMTGWCQRLPQYTYKHSQCLLLKVEIHFFFLLYCSFSFFFRRFSLTHFGFYCCYIYIHTYVCMYKVYKYVRRFFLSVPKNFFCFLFFFFCCKLPRQRLMFYDILTSAWRFHAVFFFCFLFWIF